MGAIFDILVVDDDEESREIYAEVLRENGFSVREAKDGLEAMEMIDVQKPDGLLTGIMMPRMDGFTLVETLKKNVVTASIPVFFISHLGRKEDQDRAKELGAKKFFIQGMITLAEVARTVRTILTVSEYFVEIDPRALDAQRLASDFDLNRDFLCNENGGQKLAIKLTVKDADTREFDAEIVCI